MCSSWFNFQKLYDRAATEYPAATLVEVGAWLGESLAQNGPIFTIGQSFWFQKR